MAQTITNLLLKELATETATTKKLLALVSDEKLDWKPHEKSMSFKQLATHLAEIPFWVDLAVHTDVLDFAAGNYNPGKAENAAEIMSMHDQNVAKGTAALKEADDELLLNGKWTMKHGEHELMTLSKYETVRHALAQTIHHRAQLGVFLRLNDIKLPITYGASADDHGVFG